MGITVLWDNPEQTIIRYAFDRQWTWNDFYAAKTQTDEMIEAVQHPVGVIFELPANVLIPPNALSHGKEFIDSRHTNLYLIALASPSTFLRTLFTMFRQVYPAAAKRVNMVTTLEEARTLLVAACPDSNH